jgi:hypothetical protein
LDEKAMKHFSKLESFRHERVGEYYGEPYNMGGQADTEQTIGETLSTETAGAAKKSTMTGTNIDNVLRVSAPTTGNRPTQELLYTVPQQSRDMAAARRAKNSGGEREWDGEMISTSDS